MAPQDRGDGAPSEEDSGSRLDRIFNTAFVLALLLLAFVAGAILHAANIFPGPQIASAYEGGRALYSKLTAYQDVYRSDLWFPERRPDRGVTVKDAARAEEGLTLYTSGHEAAAFLVDLDGEVVHEWRRPYSTVWNETAAVTDPQPDSHVYFRKAVAFPNGDLLVVYEGVGDTPYGYGVVKLDRNSEVIWSYLGHAHHDIDVGPDGRIYVLTHEFVAEPLKGYDNLASPRLDDFLVVLSPEGDELEKFSLIHAVADSDFRQMIHTVSSYAVGDPLHANTVDVITEEQAARFAFGEPGQVLLSFRELTAVAVLDPETSQISWATRSYWLGQHDPDILPDGNILLFDNYGNYDRAERRSRVIEFDPRTSEIVWEYSGSQSNPLDSQIRSSQQRLAGGNTLITESNGGRILEVSPEGEIVWEYINPVRGGDEDRFIPIVCWAQRLPPDFFEDGFAQTASRTPQDRTGET